MNLLINARFKIYVESWDEGFYEKHQLVLIIKAEKGDAELKAKIKAELELLNFPNAVSLNFTAQPITL